MPVRIAIPTPTSTDDAYNRKNWPAFADAVAAFGAEPVEIGLDLFPNAVAELASTCVAILLPGSPADVNPGKYGENRNPATADSDFPRENVDELLLQDAHNLYKPILGICFGAQILNVWRGGSLLQDLPTLPIDHSRNEGNYGAHELELTPGTELASLLAPRANKVSPLMPSLFVNSSHHQAVLGLGGGMVASARSAEDRVIEAIEAERSDDREHFVLGLQWHPERTMDVSASSPLIFARFVAEAASYSPRLIHTSVVG